MKEILLLTDFSKNARNAIDFALQFFKNEKCRFHIMNVHKIGSFTVDDLMLASKESIYNFITKVPKEKLEALVEDLKSEYNNLNHSFKAHIDFDVFVDAISQLIKAKNIEYVVMGTNGETGVKEVLLGSNTIHVLRKVNCKTLVIPEGYTFKSSKEILLPLHADDVIANKEFTGLLEFLETYQLHLHVLRVNPNNENSENEQQDINDLALLDCIYNTVNTVPMDYAISSYLQTNTIDFIVLFVKKEWFLDHFFTNPNTKVSISKISKPMLVLHV